MRKLGFTAAALAVAGLLAAAGGNAAEKVGDDRIDRVLADMGSELYAQYCASCHGSAGAGDGPAAGALKNRPADLTRIAERRGGFDDGEVARFIDGRFSPEAHGTREMPVWGARFGERVPEAGLSEEITRGRILVLVEYLKSIQKAD
ncbi:MAG: c-type cytochrome [Myxococcota bacterium]|nr:c-type cytochrome [Myxococcota bacterium]